MVIFKVESINNDRHKGWMIECDKLDIVDGIAYFYDDEHNNSKLIVSINSFTIEQKG